MAHKKTFHVSFEFYVCQRNLGFIVFGSCWWKSFSPQTIFLTTNRLKHMQLAVSMPFSHIKLRIGVPTDCGDAFVAMPLSQRHAMPMTSIGTSFYLFE